MIPYDPRRADVVADPYPALRRLREEDPVHWSGILGGWVLTRYADVRASLADPRLSAGRITPFLARQAPTASEAIQTLLRHVGLWVVFTDPPVHTRLRNALGRAFTACSIETRRGRIAEIVGLLLNPRGRGREMDLIRDFAYPLPVAVIGDLLGVPAEDHEQLKAWSDELAGFIGSSLGTADKYERAARAVAEMRDYFERVVARRRDVPADDLVTALLVTGERGERLGEAELIASCVLLLFAGHETTTNLIGNGALALLRHPAEARAWRENPALGLRRRGGAPLRRPHSGDGARRPRGTPDRRQGHRERGSPLPDDQRRQPRPRPVQGAGPARPRARGQPPSRVRPRHPLLPGGAAGAARGAGAMPALLARFPGLSPQGGAPEWLDSLVFRGMRSLPVALG